GSVLRFPERAEMPWSEMPTDVEAVGTRARALNALSTGRPVIVVASARSLLRALPPQGSAVFTPLVLEEGAQIELDDAVAHLARMGYTRVDIAEEPGTFAVRGGVLDVFPSDGQQPVRAELLGDEIESLRRYIPSTGQTIGAAGLTEVFTCREIAISARAATRAQRALRDKALKDPFVAYHLECIENGIYFNGIERYLPVFYEQEGVLTDYLAPSTLLVLAEPRSLFDDAARRHDELAAAAKDAGVPLAGLVVEPARLDLGGRQRLILLSLLRAGGGVDAEMTARRPEVSGGEDKFVGGLRALVDVNYSVVVAVPERRARHRITDILTEAGLSVREIGLSTDREGAKPTDLTRGMVHVSSADVPAGFVIPDARLAVVSIDDIYPRSGRARRNTREIDPTRMTFSFAPGDYVVHATHGIALFREMQHKEVLGAQRDYLVLEYAKGDRLYVPVDQIDRISKYVGAEGSAPRVTRLNTADWSKATTKARKAARKLAFDLVDLYARRSAVSGHAFVQDTTWQVEMEAMFPFEETPDQLAAIADVKADMEIDKPMDRLICGDVGYGKTEVAIRAAFKATQDGKQVMVLCPTTILAQQHFTNFSERYAPFDVRVEVLSRFRSKAQQAVALEGFTSGEVSVLVGTHRLLSRDVTPRDLGLVVVDEEQRFGVEHKEHLKNLREQVDVLTLSATPIPRTLQMSLSGVRDMSIIDTPPPNRFPVKVHVGEYDADVVSGAIRRELERGGQVYFVSNRVKSIDEAVQRVRDAVPEARIAVAHGQLSEKQLESVMERFAANEADVLVATTIIESGIDNPHSNTLIIEDSQRLGLAQLYQLKGRVGRSHVKAFAYFMFPRGQALTEQAVERLTAIREHDELGSGIKVAMRDLEIRGAGSLLGAEQHGNMSAVGFDLFAEMLREAVAEVRGEPEIAFPEIRVDLPVAAFLPEEYVADVDERVLHYRRIAGAVSVEAVARVADDLTQRHGALPEPARNLLAIARIKALASEAQVLSVTLVRRRLRLAPVPAEGPHRAVLARQGAIWLERDSSITMPVDYGTSVTDAAQAMLDVILTGA
ncbi:MAG: transcription-repair coupling factor, partial [Actinobacteria bacterium]|nr:transcription-repair coupling factor [Actinomycetota bacterium]MCG2807600.1 transcription-repair coupling factor [Coriobacteriia bacterium]